MKKYGIFKVLLLMLALLLTVSTVASCALPLLSSGNPAAEETTTDGGDDNKNPITTTPQPDNPDDPISPTPTPVDGEFTVTVTNGRLAGGSRYDEGETATMTAVTPPNGYVFSHWENAAGEQVGTTAELSVTVSGNESYKAYFTPTVSTSAPKIIMANLEKDWQQGGINATTNVLEIGASATKHRVVFAEPLLLRAGCTLKATLPDFECRAGTSECTEKTCSMNGNCGLTVAICYLEKKVEGESNNLADYSVLRYEWSTAPNIKATEDTYLVLCVKSDAHGGTISFNINTPSEIGGSVSAMSQVVVTYIEPANEAEKTALGYYWGDELSDTISKIDEIRENASSYLSEFFYITDTHWIQNAQYSPALISYIAEQVETYDVIFGGDLIYRYNAKRTDAIEDEIENFYAAFTDYTKIGEQLRIFSMLGNHDRNGSSNQPNVSERLSEQEAYELYIQRIEKWGGVTTEGDPNHSYYDDTVNKVRYVQFYFCGSQYGMIEDAYVDAAFEWASEKILELDETWTVVLLTHGYFCGSEGSKNEITPKTKELTPKVLQLKAEADADIAVWITGHNHEDRAEELVLESEETGEEIARLWLLSLNTDAYTHSNATGSYDMELGTVTEQSFSFVQVDTFNKNIYLTRVGAGVDAVYSYGEPAEGAVDDGKGSNGDDGSSTIRVNGGTMADGVTSQKVTNGETVTLTANEAPEGYRFDGWKNAAGEWVGTKDDLTLDVIAEVNETYTAVFSLIPIVDITLVDGTFTDGTTKVTISADKTVTIIADEPDNPKFYCFSHWINAAGETIGTEEEITLQVPEVDETWTAVYAPIRRPLSLVENGTFADGSRSAVCEIGDTVTLIARAPADGEVFEKWINSDGETVGTTATCEVVVNDDDTYTAVFATE